MLCRPNLSFACSGLTVGSFLTARWLVPREDFHLFATSLKDLGIGCCALCLNTCSAASGHRVSPGPRDQGMGCCALCLKTHSAAFGPPSGAASAADPSKQWEVVAAYLELGRSTGSKHRSYRKLSPSTSSKEKKHISHGHE
eukprot:1161220-Pelagomonas_calceolata.AAC.17